MQHAPFSTKPAPLPLTSCLLPMPQKACPPAYTRAARLHGQRQTSCRRPQPQGTSLTGGGSARLGPAHSRSGRRGQRSRVLHLQAASQSPNPCGVGHGQPLAAPSTAVLPLLRQRPGRAEGSPANWRQCWRPSGPRQTLPSPPAHAAAGASLHAPARGPTSLQRERTAVELLPLPGFAASPPSKRGRGRARWRMHPSRFGESSPQPLVGRVLRRPRSQ
mmetsp:Transcript_51088/g.118729  ORF Transcript_51088/g.118729 Transcript_51088/m.118729 type:complete len:218 (+) Transcript_51088:58-711(+)